MTVPALKEWAVVVRALLAGEQLLDVRKGGLREDGRHFGVRAARCWLYPTLEHQRPELIKPAYQRWVSETGDGAPPDRTLRVDGWADIVGVATVTEPDELDRIGSKLIWTDDYAKARLQWKSRDPLWVLALRAYTLDTPITLPWRDEYGGCTSWLELDALPEDPTTVPAEPALSDVSFAARLSLIERDLGKTFEAPRPA